MCGGGKPDGACADNSDRQLVGFHLLVPFVRATPFSARRRSNSVLNRVVESASYQMVIEGPGSGHALFYFTASRDGHPPKRTQRCQVKEAWESSYAQPPHPETTVAGRSHSTMTTSRHTPSSCACFSYTRPRESPTSGAERGWGHSRQTPATPASTSPLSPLPA